MCVEALPSQWQLITSFSSVKFTECFDVNRKLVEILILLVTSIRL